MAGKILRASQIPGTWHLSFDMDFVYYSLFIVHFVEFQLATRIEPRQGGGTLSGWRDPVGVGGPRQGGETLSGWGDPVRVEEPRQGGGTPSGWGDPVRVTGIPNDFQTRVRCQGKTCKQG